MVIKIMQDEGKTLSYFEYDTFHVEHLFDTPKKLLEKGDAWRLTDDTEEFWEQDKKVNVKAIYGILNGKETRGVITDRICYILDSSGKTIDTI